MTTFSKKATLKIVTSDKMLTEEYLKKIGECHSIENSLMYMFNNFIVGTVFEPEYNKINRPDKLEVSESDLAKHLRFLIDIHGWSNVRAALLSYAQNQVKRFDFVGMPNAAQHWHNIATKIDTISSKTGV